MHNINIQLEDDQYRRWVIAAGRNGQPAVDLWVSELIDKIIAAEVPGRRNVVVQGLAPEPVPEIRHCRYCGKPLPTLATSRRTYCGDFCRVRSWRRERKAGSTDVA